ncbi:MAG: helicase, partial [Spirulina sp. DLM2.Bin59]
LRAHSEGLLRRQLEAVEEEFADDHQYEAATADVLEETAPLFRPLTPEEQQCLHWLAEWGDRTARGPDSKARELLQWLNAHLKTGGNWTAERVIIFTEYRATQKWLADLLIAQGLGADERLMILYGGMASDEREKIKAAFQANPAVSPVRILLATDAASEGLDLQNHCANLIHYEIPWNPNRMEQRNGRIDRHGQRAKAVMIYHFVGKGYQDQAAQGCKPGELEGDLEFLMRAAQKINTIREDLGKVGPVIAAQVEEAMLGQRSQLDTAQAEEDSKPLRQLLKFERQVQAQIAQLKANLDQTRQQLRLDPANILTVVQVGLKLADQPPLMTVPGEPHLFHLPPLKGSWQVASEGLAHPHTQAIRPITFDPDVARGRDDLVLAHLNHRLVQMCLRLLRAEVWSRGEQRKLHRVTIQQIPTRLSEVPVVVAYGRLVILGGDQQRLNEEVITAGGVIREGRFRRLNVLQLNQLLQAATPDPVPESVRASLANLWDLYGEPLKASLEKRMGDRLAALQKQLTEREQQDLADIATILTELQRSIEKELNEGNQPRQLELFSASEQEQFERNRQSLQLRLAQIPQEIITEQTLIRQRYANPTPRLFPLAIAFLVPPKIF